MFSGKKLTHLQRQVCTHILHGIQRETVRLKEEWNALLQSDQNDIFTGTDAISHDATYVNSRVSDSYCFELLSQVNICPYLLELVKSVDIGVSHCSS